VTPVITTITATLTPCPDCEAPVSPAAATCPHCGRPLNDYVLTVIPGPRWSWTIYWGIVLVILIPVVITVVTTILLAMVIFGVGVASR
jgi:hypothetical protein